MPGKSIYPEACKETTTDVMAERDRPLPNAGDLPTRNYRFDELRLQVDHRLQIEPATAHAIQPFYTSLLGYLRGSSLIIKLPTSWNGTVPFGEGETVLVRGFSGRIAYFFTSDILKIRFAPYPHCHISFPTIIQGSEIRKAMRVRANIPAQLTNLRSGGDKAMEASISDLSALGVHTESAAHLGEPGDDVRLEFRFLIQPDDYEITINCAGVIQNSRHIEVVPAWHHGIRFQNLPSMESIMLQHLIYEQLLETTR
jgi:hypothetical protein